MNKKVSIIVPIYNSARFLNTSINSLILQYYNNLEIILFDDGSTDNSLSICREFASKDKRIKVFTRENKGVSQTRLDAFYLSSGDYITFVDADDYVSKDYVSLMVEHLEREDVDAVSSQHYVVNNLLKQKFKRSIHGRLDRKEIDELLKTSFLYDKKTHKAGITHYLWTKMIKREFVEKLLLQGIGMWYGEDLVGVTQLLYSINSLYVSEDYTYYYVSHSQQITKKYDFSLLQMQTILWQRLISIDTKQLLQDTLPTRMMLHLYNTLSSKMIVKVKGYKDFKQQIEEIYRRVLGREFMQELFWCKNIKLKWQIRFVFHLLKHRLYFLTYIFLKTNNLLKEL